MCEMAEVLGDKETQQKYSGILLKGKEAFERLLWNGGCSSVGNHTGRGAGVGYPFTLFYFFFFFAFSRKILQLRQQRERHLQQHHVGPVCGAVVPGGVWPGPGGAGGKRGGTGEALLAAV